ncbi:hypothetical protein [Tropicimonas marinistellae]|uniref:hypothetical protein n=1 Tax=Tropicimonas marinistellae TaxID=1739787 RepID=UPI0008339AA3|nr:hypothetical protein [Tropicimonas marinistellae]
MSSHISVLAVLLGLSTSAMAQDHYSHMQHMEPKSGVSEPGQSAFGAIQEIVDALQADPKTDWRLVDIDALRAHLVDMDNVTLWANVTTHPIDGGAEFRVASSDPSVRASIQAMVTAHAATMNGSGGLEQVASRTPGGAILRVTGEAGDKDRIFGLGFFGILSLGAHHQAHHLAMARGEAPHFHGID